MTDNRSERLRRRRKQSTAGAPDQDSADDEAQSNSSTPDVPTERTDSAESGSSDEEVLSVKEEQVGTYMYLPESQTKELRRQYNILKAEYEFEYDEEFEKNRHFYPLVIQYGLESLEGITASEIRTRLEEL